jgi:hypothetical protein
VSRRALAAVAGVGLVVRVAVSVIDGRPRRLPGVALDSAVLLHDGAASPCWS